MFRLLFLLFVIIPIIEISVLMHVGAWLGTWPTIGIVIFTAWLGARNVREQGIATMTSVQTKMAQGEMPSDEIVTGLILLVAGVLLVTPGFVTDIFGLSLLVPSVRAALVESVKKHVIVNQMSASASFSQQSTGFSGNVYEHEQQPREPSPQSSLHHGETIEGEYERKD
jgi:UPF0716 protein FxsA